MEPWERTLPQERHYEYNTLKVERSQQEVAFDNELDEIKYYEKKITAQTFIRRGLGIMITRNEIGKLGGLF